MSRGTPTSSDSVSRWEMEDPRPTLRGVSGVSSVRHGHRGSSDLPPDDYSGRGPRPRTLWARLFPKVPSP